MSKITTHVRQARRPTDVDAATLLATAADLTNLPEWWFSEGSPDAPPLNPPVARHVKPVDGGGTTARPGVQVDVVSAGIQTSFAGGDTVIEAPSVIRFTCETAGPGHALVLTHRNLDGEGTSAKIRTDLRIDAEADGSHATLIQHTEVRGRGPGARLARAAHRRSDWQTDGHLQWLIALASGADRRAAASDASR